MSFHINARFAAEGRQSKNDGLGPRCAKCYKPMIALEPDAVPRVPFAKGGSKKADNCVLLCDKCYLEVGGENHPDVIPHSELPYFRV